MKTKKIQPRGKQVLLQPNKPESKELDNGLVLPSNVEQEQKAVGKVIAVGPQIKDIKKGDTVIYGLYAGERLKLREGDADVDYVLLYSDDVLAFLK